MDEVKERKLKLLIQKNEERKAKLNSRAKETVDEESINNVLVKFEFLEKEILNCIKQIEDNVSKESLQELFDLFFKNLEKWNDLLNLSYHLPSYNKKILKIKYQEFNEQRQTLEQTLVPDKKFSFQKREKKPSNLCKDVVDTKILKKYSFDTSNEFGDSDKENEILNISHDNIFEKDAVFRNLKSSQLNIEGGANTIHFVSLIDCKVFCGPISTSVFVESCHNCTFVLACQQLRIHETYNCNFYTHITSSTIIENSKEIHFAPYNYTYKNIENHFKLTNLDINTNRWNIISDFNWLSSSPSPNWNIINN